MLRQRNAQHEDDVDVDVDDDDAMRKWSMFSTRTTMFHALPGWQRVIPWWWLCPPQTKQTERLEQGSIWRLCNIVWEIFTQKRTDNVRTVRISYLRMFYYIMDDNTLDNNFRKWSLVETLIGCSYQVVFNDQANILNTFFSSSTSRFSSVHRWPICTRIAAKTTGVSSTPVYRCCCTTKARRDRVPSRASLSCLPSEAPVSPYGRTPSINCPITRLADLPFTPCACRVVSKK